MYFIIKEYILAATSSWYNEDINKLC